jgi:hypothetical protein
MAGEETIAALLTIWDEGAAAENWLELMPRLVQLVDQYEQDSDDDLRAEIALRVADLLRDRNPALHRTLIQTRKALRAGQASARLGTRGVPPAHDLAAPWQAIRAKEVATHGDRIDVGNITDATGVAIGKGAQATVHQHFHEPRYTRYTDIACPRRVWIHDRITLTVALTFQPQAESAAQQAIDVFAGTVKVRLAAPGFEPLSAQEQTIVIDPDEESPPVVFHLKAHQPGRYAITIQFWQRGNMIAAVPVPIDVLDVQPVAEPAIIAPVAVNPWMAGVPAPDLTLVITHDAAGRAEYTLHADGVAIFSTEAAFPSAPQQFMEQLYAERGLWQPVPDDHTGQAEPPDAKQMAWKLTQLGYLLWDQLIPTDLQQFYARERARWRITDAQDRRWSFFVQSSEAAIPWELVRPYGSDADRWEEAPWCHTFAFARWLLPQPAAPACCAPLPRLPLTALAAIVPPNDTAQTTTADAQGLVDDLIQRYGLHNRSPQRASEADLLALLEQGTFDWMHIVTPGERDVASGHAQGAIHLESGERVPISAITGPQIRRMLHDQRPAFVFQSRHAPNQSASFSSATAWATHLVGAGAGMLIAPRWSVSATQATRFSQVFYEALLRSTTPLSVAEALWSARDAIRQADDPAWLAYSLFAHPNATVVIDRQT